jgi:1-acyl-sn-glycerol-3-phosphate acyltransferase
MSSPSNGIRPFFIPEKVSPVFTRIFYWYMLTLYRRRFRAVWLDDRQMPRTTRATLCIGNHNTWWDALNPLLLNERVIGKQARAMMDEEQLLRYPFFRRLGVFSINRQHPRKALASLEHAARLLNESGLDKRPVCLWSYPEGKLVRPDMPIVAENGITWLIRKLDPDRTEIVPFAAHIHAMRGDKPELFVRIGPSIDPRMFAMTGEPARDQAQTRRIAGIIEQLRESVRRDSADFTNPGPGPDHGPDLEPGTKPDSNPDSESGSKSGSESGRSGTEPGSESGRSGSDGSQPAVDGFRLLLGRPY